jgi:two-component system LytT family response regulator
VRERVRVLVVDDEPLARRNLRLLLGRDDEVEVVGERRDGPAAVRAIQDLAPDVVFLDVQMPEMDGFEVLQAVGGEVAPVVVFVTAWEEHAVRAFEVHALDYLLKPFSDARFAAALARAKAAVRRGALEDLGRRVAGVLDERQAFLGSKRPGTGGPALLRRFVLRSAGRVLFLPAAEVDWVEAADYYVRLHAGGRRHLVRYSMNELERRLDPASFLRVHRSAIANLHRIRELRDVGSGGGTVVLGDGTELPLSRRRRRRVERRLASR